jgi:hypothetical protein
MIFNDNGICIGFKEPIIHVFNKSEASIHDGHNKKINGRQNVILLGDSLGDVHMADGINHKVKLSIGFLNHDVENLLPLYEDAFDVVLLNDTSLEWVLMLLSALR